MFELFSYQIRPPVLWWLLAALDYFDFQKFNKIISNLKMYVFSNFIKHDNIDN
jgi:hypothetical protein